MHLDHPIRWLDAILELKQVLVLAFRELGEVEEVDGVHTQFGDQVGVEVYFGRQSEIREHFFGVENHFIRIT